MLEKQSCCKVNLLLNILGKRPDGFHELETLMHPVPLHDRLTFERAGAGIQLTCSEPSLPVNSKNLVYRAAELFLETAGIRDGVRMALEKNLPIAAGMGGGSGNAATTLAALNELFGHPLSSETLSNLAGRLGSDIPFFLQERPALATGRGEEVRPVDFFPALRNTWILLVQPGFGVSTPWAYQQLAHFPAAVSGRPGRAAELAQLLRADDRAAAGAAFYNSLEAPVLRKYPLLALFQRFFRENGAWVALMSGSGSTTFALVETAAAADGIREKLLREFGDKMWSASVKLMSNAC